MTNYTDNNQGGIEDDINAAHDEIEDARILYEMNNQPPEALVIHCGDVRFQNAFRRFIKDELGIRSYTPIIIGGGVHAFGMQSFLPKNFKILWEQIKFHLKKEDLRQVIIINHEDCGWYEKMKGYHIDLPTKIKGRLDLKDAAISILNDFAGIRVRMFWAGIDKGSIYFDEIKLS